jgi:hypothetical protein
MATGKIGSPLAQQLNDSPADDWLDVIVEIEAPELPPAPDAGRAAKIEIRQRAFERQSEPAIDLIRSLGGEVTDWAKSQRQRWRHWRMASGRSCNSDNAPVGIRTHDQVIPVATARSIDTNR